MKKKNLLISASLALGVGVGVFAGIGLHNGVAEVNEVKAATETTVYCAVDLSASYGGSTIDPENFGMKCNVAMTRDDGKAGTWQSFTMVNIGDTTSYPGKSVFSATFTDLWDGLGALQFQVTDSGVWKAQDEVFKDEWIGASTYNGKLKVYGEGSWVDYDPPGEMFDVTKYAVINGEKQSTPINSSSVLEGTVYDVPPNAVWSGYHFVGWYTNEACTAEFHGSTIAADLDLFAKFVSLSKDSYIYYITDSSSATPNLIHTWGGDVEYSNSGVTVVSVATEVHGVMRFRNTDYLIYKIPFSSESGDTELKFYWGDWEKETDAKTLVAGNAYQWLDGGIATDEVAGGDALDFLLEFEGIRNAVVAAGDIKSTSICGISSSNVAKLCKDYNGLSETARGYVDASYTYTYKGNDPKVNDNVSFYDMMEELASRPGGVTLVGHSGAKIASNGISAHSESAVFAAAAAASIALLGTAGFFLLRRRKEN